MHGDDFCSSFRGRYPSDCELTEALRNKAASRSAAAAKGDARRFCLSRAKHVKLLLLDVDGVLTDGTITYAQDGVESKSFNIKDGLGIRLLKKAGIETGLITARASEAVTRRARDLALVHVYQRVKDKVDVFTRLCRELQLPAEAVAYMGDDWLDIPLLSRVGFSATVADAAPEVRRLVHYITGKPGGKGAVREVCDLILEATGVHQTLLASYLGGTPHE